MTLETIAGQCPATGNAHRWRRETRRRPADCADCAATRCAGYIAGRGIIVTRCPYPAVGSPAGALGDTPSCADHYANPGGTRC